MRVGYLILCSLAGLAAAAQPAAIGPVTAFTRETRGVELQCAGGTTVTLTVLASDLVRVRALWPGQPAAPDHSWALAGADWPAVPWRLTTDDTALTLATDVLQVVVHRQPLLIEFRDPATGRVINADAQPMARDPATGEVTAAKRLGFDEHFYGLGEKASALDHRRGKFVLWNSDTPGYVAGRDPLYQSIPFYLGLEDGRGYGLFYDNSYRSTFTFGDLTQEYAGYSAAGGELNYYFFQGPSLKQVVSRYTELTGRMPLPPLWSLGHQQSRYSYYPDSMVERVVDEYRARDLPLDVVHLDIHYMDGFRVFTWNPQRFPDPAGLIRRLAAQGVRAITIVDPGIKYEPAVPGRPAPYPVFAEGLAHDYFLRQRDGSLYVGEVWPGPAVFVDYTKESARRWWGDQLHTLTDAGVAGIWTDMNEPADFTDQTGERHRNIVFDDLGTKSPYAKNRNVFALNMARATYEGLARLQPDGRPFVITRAGYAGIQRYAVTWTGDNNATFAGLALNLPMFANMGLSGQPFVGSDLPGFIGRGSGELLARAYEVATFVPFSRNHGAIDQYDHEPWRYGKPYEDIVRRYLKLRYRLLPFLYTAMETAHRTGLPVFRPLVLDFQDDPSTLNLDDQFMVGDTFLVAPVLLPGERGREVYLPAGRWYDFWTGAALAGTGDLLRVGAPLDHLPLYVRGGSIVPSTVAMNHTGEKPWDPLTLDIYPDAQGTAAGSLYEDDGLTRQYAHGAFRRTTFDFQAGRLTWKVDGQFQVPARTFAIVLHAAPAGAAVWLDGVALPAAAWTREASGPLTVHLADDGRPHQLEFR
ncbi:MAG: glycoside hydrolase family 31 protein [Opitutales bacterium]